jgi:hypothetical protein
MANSSCWAGPWADACSSFSSSFLYATHTTRSCLDRRIELARLTARATLIIVVCACAWGPLVQIQMNNLYGLTDFEIGLAYVPFGLGTVFGTLLGGKVS